MGVVELDLSLQVATLDHPTWIEATLPGPSPMEIFTPNVIVLQREEEVGQVDVVREEEITIQVEEGEDAIGAEEMKTRVRRSLD